MSKINKLLEELELNFWASDDYENDYHIKRFVWNKIKSKYTEDSREVVGKK